MSGITEFLKKHIAPTICGGFGALAVIAIIGLVLLVCHQQNGMHRPVVIGNYYPIKNDTIRHQYVLNDVNIKIKQMEDLYNKGVFLTPQEYTNNIISFYNTIIVLLICLLTSFSILSLVQINQLVKSKVDSLVREELLHLLKDEEFSKQYITNNIIGLIDDAIWTANNENSNESEDISTRLTNLENSIKNIHVSNEIKEEGEVDNNNNNTIQSY